MKVKVKKQRPWWPEIGTVIESFSDWKFDSDDLSSVLYIDLGEKILEEYFEPVKELRYSVGDEVYVTWPNGDSWETIMEVKEWSRHPYILDCSNNYLCRSRKTSDSFIDHDKTEYWRPKEVKSWEDLGMIDWWYTFDNHVGKWHKRTSTLDSNKNTRATKEQAEASIAMAQLSQLMKAYEEGINIVVSEELKAWVEPIRQLISVIDKSLL